MTNLNNCLIDDGSPMTTQTVYEHLIFM